MSIHRAAGAMIDALNELGIGHLLVGSLAASYYGLTRSTVEADFVVQLGEHKLSDVVRRMGAEFQLSPQAGFEIFPQKRIDEILVVGTVFKLDVFPLTEDSFDQERFRRRRKVALGGRTAFVPTAEDVIVAKLRWGRAKDLEDAKDVANMQCDFLDWAYIEQWSAAHETQAELAEVRRALLPP